MEELRKEENKMPLTIDKETIEKHPLYKDGIKKGIKKEKMKKAGSNPCHLLKHSRWSSFRSY